MINGRHRLYVLYKLKDNNALIEVVEKDYDCYLDYMGKKDDEEEVLSLYLTVFKKDNSPLEKVEYLVDDLYDILSWRFEEKDFSCWLKVNSISFLYENEEKFSNNEVIGLKCELDLLTEEYSVWVSEENVKKIDLERLASEVESRINKFLPDTVLKVTAGIEKF